MPRPRKPPRLHLRPARPGHAAVFVILDGGREISTGFGPGREREAEQALGSYLAEKHRPDWADGTPRHVFVADVLAHYLNIKAPDQAHPELAAIHVRHLLDHFEEAKCSEVGGSGSVGYRRARMAGEIGGRSVSGATARRELETLQAALKFAVKDGKLLYAPAIDLGPKGDSSPRWLTRSEAARLLAGALGWRTVALDGEGRAIKWQRVGPPSYHVARFILVGLYTGSRHETILRFGWQRSPDRGWFDLAAGVFYRRGHEERQTKKERSPAGINLRLEPHLRRWGKLTTMGPCEYDGRIIQKQRTGFDRARELAGLDEEVTPHTLKHTCITWMLQEGVTTWEVAGYTCTSEATIRTVYGHHSPHAMPAARKAFLGRNLGASRS